MTTHTATDRAAVPDEATATQIYRIVIRATPERIWDALTLPEFTRRYFYGADVAITRDRRTSYGPDGDLRGHTQVLEWDPPRRLVHDWRSLYDDRAGGEPPSRVTWEIESFDDGTCLVTAIHDRLDASPYTRTNIAGAGWMGVLSALKTLLETGEPLHPRFGR